MCDEYKRLLSDSQAAKSLAFCFDNSAAPTANRRRASRRRACGHPLQFKSESRRTLRSPPPIKFFNTHPSDPHPRSTGTAKRVSTVPKAPQPQRAAAPDPVWNRDNEGSRHPGAPSSSTGENEASRALQNRFLTDGVRFSKDGQSPGPSQFNIVWYVFDDGLQLGDADPMNLNSQTRPRNVPVKHDSVAHSSRAAPGSRPQGLAAELPTGPAPSSRPAHVPTSNEGAFAVPQGLDVSIRSITSSGSKGRPPAQASSSRPQRTPVPKRPAQALLDDEESRSTYYSPSGGGRDVPNDDDYISDTRWTEEDREAREIKPKPEREFFAEIPSPRATRASVEATFSTAPHSDPSSSTTTIPQNLNRNKYTVLNSNFAPRPVAEFDLIYQTSKASASTSARPQPAPRVTTNIGIEPTDRHQAEIPVLDPNSKIGHKMRNKLRTMNGGDMEKQNEERLALAAWADEVSSTMNAHTKRRHESTRYMRK
ncbi:hypothetical protein FRC00_003849 [Tulasnella sp. 408]|nr:hypothetical protein FRC00_003849 [Tulasnella sp. 408]